MNSKKWQKWAARELTLAPERLVLTYKRTGEIVRETLECGHVYSRGRGERMAMTRRCGDCPKRNARQRRGRPPMKRFPLQAGQAGYSLKPRVEVVFDGPRSCLWIGNGGIEDQRCFGTLGGPVRLRKLAKTILAALDSGKPPVYVLKPWE